MRSIRRGWGGLAVTIALVSAWPVLAGEPASQPSGDWPRWRGPRGDNVPAIAAFPEDLDTGLTKLWAVDDLNDPKTKGPTAATASYSCPSIAGDRLVVTGRRGAKDLVVCLNADTGAPIWKKEYDAPGGQVQYGNGPRATPLIDGDVVYTFGCLGRVACWSMKDGAEIWKRDAAAMGGKMPMWGFSGTPLLLGERLIVQVGGKNLAVALDRKTGNTLWSSEAGDCGYAAVTALEIGGATQVIVFGGTTLAGLDPANGKTLWQCKWPTAFGMNCTTPLLIGPNRILVCSSDHGGKGGMAAVDVNGGEATLAWENHKVGPGHNDPVILGRFAYAYTGYSLDPKGFVCVDLSTGEQKWFNEEIGGPGSAVQIGKDRALCLSNRGDLSLIKPTDRGMRLFSKRTVFENAHPVWTQPVIARGKLYLRYTNQLVCYQIAP